MLLEVFGANSPILYLDGVSQTPHAPCLKYDAYLTFMENFRPPIRHSNVSKGRTPEFHWAFGYDNDTDSNGQHSAGENNPFIFIDILEEADLGSSK